MTSLSSNNDITGVILQYSSMPSSEHAHVEQCTTTNDLPICLHCYEEPALPDIAYCADCLEMYQREARREYQIALREGGYYICFPEAEGK